MADNSKDNKQAKSDGKAEEKRAPITPEANDQDPNTAKTLETGFDGDTDLGTHRVSHNEGGPRGFETAANGTVMLSPGQEANVTLTEAEEKRLKTFKIFKIEKQEAKKD